MALGTNHVTNTSAATFIPELWSDEVIAEYEKSLKMSPLVRKMPMTGKKGDTMHVPKPVRGDASAKTAETQVTLISNVEGELIINIDRHFEYSRLIEDITDVQALSSLRKFYTSDAGYALATRVDTDLINCATGFGDGTRTIAPAADGSDWTHSASFYVDGANGLASYAANTVADTDVITDLAIREAIKILDDNNVPMEGRSMVIPPVARKDLMGIDRFVSTDFVTSKPVETGFIGNLYGVDIYVSSNAPVVCTAANNTASSNDTRGILLFHKDAIVHAEQMAVRSQSQYKQEYLSDLYTADCLYGVETYRPESGVVIAVND